MKPYYKYTSYKDIEDFKRLDFIVESVDLLQKKEGLRILDVGCGNGVISRSLG